MARKTSTETNTNANPELILALDMLEKEKGIKKEVILEAIRVSLESAYKKNYTKDSDKSREPKDENGEQERHKEDVSVEIDAATGTVEVFAKKVVVEKVEDGACEITLEQARQQDAKYDLGDIVNVSVTPKNFCRIAAQHAKSVIVQKIKEAERQNVFDIFHSKEHEVITGVVQRVERKSYVDREGNERTSNRVIIALDDRTEVALMEKECVPGEQFLIGEHVKVYVVDVKDNTKGPHIVISRTHPELVKRLLEKEVTEIADGTVELKNVAREAGSRSKISVWAKDENVDAVGACVGLNGARINAIVNDLKGEKIDVINWDPDPVILIGNALSPSKVVSVKVCLADKSAKVVVPDYQLSLAIGKRGQNASLAARLTGYKIDIMSESQALEAGEEDDDKLYIGEGEYVYYDANGNPKDDAEELTETALEAQELPESSAEEVNDSDFEEFEEIPEGEFEELSEEEFEEMEELSEDEFEELSEEEFEEIEELPEE